MPEIILTPIARVRNTRTTTEDDNWGGLVSEIVLDEALPEEAFLGIETFSHIEVVFYFHLVEPGNVTTGARHPRGNPDFPLAGIFAQRNKDRPNRLGLTVVKMIRREGRSLFVEGLDAVDGTPVLDLKPVMEEFLPRDPVRQPDWSHELMRDYWSRAS